MGHRVLYVTRELIEGDVTMTLTPATGTSTTAERGPASQRCGHLERVVLR